MSAHPHGREATFWIEEINEVQPLREPSGCDLCQHCRLVRLLGRRPAAAREGQRRPRPAVKRAPR
jgi:hypothetical protein